MSGGRSPKHKGTRVERELVQVLFEHGLVCARVPLSGAVGGTWLGDIHLELLNRTLRVEVKARACFATLHRWLSKADLLLLKADRLEPVAVLPLLLLAELAASSTKTVPAPADAPAPELAASISFDPIPEMLFCACGADSFTVQRCSDGSAVVGCPSCRRELARIAADLELRS
jgi:hypothetical protein